MDDVNIFCRKAKRCDHFTHAFPNNDISGGCPQSPVAQIGKATPDWATYDRNTKLGGNFGINVLQPIDQMRAAAFCLLHGDNRDQRWIGHGDKNIVSLHETA